jgi:SpoVK/Ycf46/Vps4 family AAA+-type ATPase
MGQGGKSDGGVGDRIGQEFLKYWEDREVPGSYWVATANGLDNLLHWSGGALINRFDAVFFLDMPTKAECMGIAKIWSEKLDVDIPKKFDFEGWTGRDIKKLANTMSMMGVCADKAAKFVIPTAQALGPRLGEIKKKAANVCIPASASEIVPQGVRKIKIAK